MTIVGVGEAWVISVLDFLGFLEALTLVVLEVEGLGVVTTLRVDVVMLSVLVAFKEVDGLSEDEDLRDGFCELVVFL